MGRHTGRCMTGPAFPMTVCTRSTLMCHGCGLDKSMLALRLASIACWDIDECQDLSAAHLEWRTRQVPQIAWP